MIQKSLERCIPLIVVAAALFSFPVIERSVRSYINSVKTMVMHPLETYLQTWQPYEGEYFQHEPNVFVREMVKKHGLTSYSVSSLFKKGAWVYQIAVTSTWPVHIEPDARYRFIMASEPIPEGCQLVEGKETKLVSCP